MSTEGVVFYRRLSVMARKRQNSPSYYISLPPELRRLVHHGQLYQVALILQGTTPPAPRMNGNPIGVVD